MNFLKKALSRFRHHRHERQFRGVSILQNPEAGRLIRSRIEAGDPLMVSRFSTCEMNVLNAHRQRLRNAPTRRITSLLTGVPPDYTKKIRFQAQNNAGVFPATDEGLDHFAQITLKACARIDVLGIWSNSLRLEETLYNEQCPSATLIPLHAIDPYDKQDPWSAALKGKKVLVIHPFEKSIRKQYLKHELLFPSSDVLPEFDLKTIKAVQSAAGNPVEFASWVEAFESMKAQIDLIDFDIALIGAGAYGLPLAAHIKDLGKQAVHMGGMLQLLFGIKGARWDSRPEISELYNEHWVRPLSSETPQSFQNVEEGCYW